MFGLNQRILYKILELPKHLQTTILTVYRLGTCTAEDVCAVTHKARAVESAYLNQLLVMGAVSKVRHGRKTYFSLVREALEF